MKKKFTILFLLIAVGISAQLKTHSFEDMDELQKLEPKPIVVFVYTDWCKICKLMKNTTLQNEDVISELNEHFYYVPFNAEDKEDIKFRNYTFSYIPNGKDTGTHELAERLSKINNTISYPTITILNNKFEIVFQYNMSLSAEELLTILTKIKQS